MSETPDTTTGGADREIERKLDEALSRIDDLEDENAELRALCEALSRRINTNHEHIRDIKAGGPTEGGSGGPDGRDERVVDQLERGERVNVTRLRKLYRSHTDVRNDDTLRDRVASLTDDPRFKPDGHNVWVYRGGGGD